ncbi:MAG: NUDIX hydrolase [Anaerolineae bacterium]|nr:NUDIX hydrolase [Anaerolineae bacterium]
MMQIDHPITPLDSHRAFDCPWYGVRQDRIRLPGGSEGVYNVVETADAVWVVPVTTTGEIVLLYHYRYPLRRWGWELPSGRIEDGQSPDEAARRELREEAGGQAVAWDFLFKASTMNGIGTQHACLYLATGVTLGETDHEPAEVIQVHTFPIQQVMTMARSGEINDAVSVLALLLAEPALTRLQE